MTGCARSVRRFVAGHVGNRRLRNLRMMENAQVHKDEFAAVICTVF